MYYTKPFHAPPDRVRTAQASPSRTAAYAAVLLTLASLALFAINAHQGIGVYSDSTRYMGISERPYDAPFYPWLLAGVETFGWSQTDGATIVGVIALTANVPLLLHLLMRGTGQVAYATGGTVLIVFSPQFVTLHSAAMSEPVFLTLLLATLTAALNYLDSGKRIWLFVCGAALGAATLTRFTAPPLGAAIALTFLLNRHHPFGRRVYDAAIVAVIGGAIFFAWVLISQLTAGRSIGRDLWFYGTMGPKEWFTSLEVLTAWFLPDNFPFAIRVTVLAWTACAAALLVIRQGSAAITDSAINRQSDQLMPVILGLFIVFHMAFMILSTALEANLLLNSRYAFPMYVSAIMLLCCLLAEIRNSHGRQKILHAGMVALAITVMAGHVLRTGFRSADAYKHGVGFQHAMWTASPTVAAVRKLPQGSVIFSNGADVVSFLAHRPAHFSPQKVALRTNVPDNSFANQTADLQRRANGHPVYVVYFDNVDWRFYLASENELRARLRLIETAKFSDGRIYRVAPLAVERGHLTQTSWEEERND